MRMTLGRAFAACGMALLLSGCGERPEPAVAEEGVEVVALAAKAVRREHVPLLGAQVVSLSKGAPTSLERPLAPARGVVHYGAIRLGNGAPLAFALLETDGQQDWLLFVDSGLANDLTLEPPIASRPVSIEQDGRTIRGAHFPPVEVKTPAGRGPGAFMFDFYLDGERAIAEIRSAFYLAGETSMITGRPTQMALFDANANGVFGDVAPSADTPGDALWLDLDGDGRVDPEREIFALTPRFFIGGRAFSFAFADDLTLATVREESSDFGRLERAGAEPGERLVAQVYSDEYGLLGPLEDARIPAGEYRLLAYEVRREDGDGETWSLTGGWMPSLAPKFVIRREETTLVRFGPPVAFRAWTEYGEDREGRGMVEAIVALRGAAGENVRIGRKEALADWGEGALIHRGEVIAESAIRHMRDMPGAGVGLFGPVEGIEKGTPLTLEARPEFGPWSGLVRPTVEVVYGRRTPHRLIVSAIVPGSQADEAGVRIGDMILSHGGRAIESLQDMGEAIRDSQGRPSVRLVVLRDGQEIGFDLGPGRVGVETMLVLP